MTASPEDRRGERRWQKLRRGEIAAAAERGAVVLQPIGSIEQHGPHLPVDTDSTIATEICHRVAARDEPPMLVLPTISWGLSSYWMPFAGTITLRASTLLHLLTDIAEGVRSHGFERLVFVNGHGGNSGIVEAVAAEVSTDRFRAAAVSYYRLIAPVIASECDLDGPGANHSGQMETSVQLHLAPDDVDLSEVTPEDCTPVDGRTDHRGPGYLPPHPLVDSPSGVYGQAWAGSADRGQRIVEAACDAVARFVVTFHAAHRASAPPEEVG